VIVLASASPRRRDLLASAGLQTRIEPAGVDETVEPGIAPELAARELAERQASFVAEAHRGEAAWVVGADTVVAVPALPGEPGDWTLLGKPSGPDEAAAMLRRLSGSRHQVVTGVCVVDAASDRRLVSSERTWVTMRALSAEEVRSYVESGEWRDKAGGYAIQESADAFVTRLEEGRMDNVVGLPVERTLALLEELGARPLG